MEREARRVGARGRCMGARGLRQYRAASARQSCSTRSHLTSVDRQAVARSCAGPQGALPLPGHTLAGRHAPAHCLAQRPPEADPSCMLAWLAEQQRPRPAHLQQHPADDHRVGQHHARHAQAQRHKLDGVLREQSGIGMRHGRGINSMYGWSMAGPTAGLMLQTPPQDTAVWFGSGGHLPN